MRRRAGPVLGAVTTTAGTTSPGPIGRSHRSSLNPSIVCFSSRTLRDERRFVERELLARFVEIEPRRRLDAVGAVAEVHLVAVDREDFLLGVPLLDLNREDDLAHLALEQLLLGQAEVIEVARHLLRQR